MLPEAIEACKVFTKLATLTGEPMPLERLAALGEFRTFENGHFLLCSGQPASCMYILTEGEVALELIDEVDEPLRVESLSAGDVLGWSWLNPGASWQFDGLAIGSVRALAFDAGELRAFCETDPVWGNALMLDLIAVFSDRLTHTRMRLVENLV